jgi:hypothetical protein
MCNQLPWLRTHTTVSNDWIAAKLAMRHPGSVSRVVSAGRVENSMTDKRLLLESLLNRVHAQKAILVAIAR